MTPDDVLRLVADGGWAAQNGCGYGHKGRPPKEVMDAYLAAQDGAA